MIQALIGPIASLAGTWLEGKVEKTKAETGAKVARAKALLRDPAKSIAAVAFDAGFKDPEYFAKVFKQETDMKPTEYRRMI